jgi:hypothetical protein
MKILRDTLSIVTVTETDPGDYPSGGGGYALKARQVPCVVNGVLVVEVEDRDWLDLQKLKRDLLEIANDIERLNGLRITDLRVIRQVWNVLHLSVIEIDDKYWKGER